MAKGLYPIIQTEVDETAIQDQPRKTKNNYFIHNKRAENYLKNGELALDAFGWTIPSSYKVNFLIDEDGSRFARFIAIADITEGAYITQNFSKVITTEDFGNSNINNISWVTAQMRKPEVNSETSKIEFGTLSYTGEYTENSVFSPKVYEINEEANIWHNEQFRWPTNRDPIFLTVNAIAFGFATAAAGDYFDIKNAFACNLTELFGVGNEPDRDWCLENLINCPNGKELDNSIEVVRKVSRIYTTDEERKVRAVYYGVPSGIENFNYSKSGDIYTITGAKNTSNSVVEIPNDSLITLNVGSFTISNNVQRVVIPEKVGLSSNSFVNKFYNSRYLRTAYINNPNIVNMVNTFYNCVNLTGSPICGNNVNSLGHTYHNCRNLTGSPVCGENVTTLVGTYYQCVNLTGSPVCGEKVNHFINTYYGCTNLTGMPVCGNNVRNMYQTYRGCTNLNKMPIVIKSTVNNMTNTFRGCNALPSGNVYIYSTDVASAVGCFNGKNTSNRYDIYYINKVNNTTSSTATALQRTTAATSLVNLTLAWTNSTDNYGTVHSNSKYNIYLHPLNSIEQLDEIRQMNQE